MMDDGITLWRQVADDIRSEIVGGVIEGRLSSETDLAARYQVNRHTIRRALAALNTDGLLRTERGRGTFINPISPKIAYPIGTRARFSENMAKQSLEASGRLVNSTLLKASPTLAVQLDVQRGDSLHCLEHLSVVNGTPISRSMSYFSAHRFPNIIADYAETGSITKALHRHAIEDYKRLRTNITAERASKEDFTHLHCTSDSIIVVSKAIDVDGSGKPIQAIETRFLADRIELIFEATIL